MIKTKRKKEPGQSALNALKICLFSSVQMNNSKLIIITNKKRETGANNLQSAVTKVYNKKQNVLMFAWHGSASNSLHTQLRMSDYCFIHENTLFFLLFKNLRRTNGMD